MLDPTLISEDFVSTTVSEVSVSTTVSEVSVCFGQLVLDSTFCESSCDFVPYFVGTYVLNVFAVGPVRTSLVIRSYQMIDQLLTGRDTLL